MSDAAEVAELRQQLAELRALLPGAEPPLQIRPPRYEPTPPTTKTLALIGSSGPLRRLTIRQIRQLAVAVALSRGALTLPGAEVPADYAPDMERLADARDEGLSWRAALERCGLEVPDDSEVRDQAQTLRGELRGLWDGLEPILGELQRRMPNWQYLQMLDTFRVLLV